MNINRERFLNNLEVVKAGLSPREFIEQSSCFCFEDGWVMTFNDEVACRKRIKDLDGEPITIQGAVPANALLSMLAMLPEPELQLSEPDDKRLQFKGKGRAFYLIKEAEIHLPIDRVDRPEEEDWQKLNPAFIEAVGRVQDCVSKDESRFMLTCVHITPKFVEACDNLQMMRYAVKTGIKEDLLVRGTSILPITELQMTKFALTKSWIHFRNKTGLVFSCRRYSEDYPPLDEILDCKGHEVKIPNTLAEASDRAAVLALDKTGEPVIKVRLSNGMVRVIGEGPIGGYKEVRKIDYEGPSVEFYIAPRLLRYIAEKYKEAVINPKRLKAIGESWQYATVLGDVNAIEQDDVQPAEDQEQQEGSEEGQEGEE